MSTQATGPGKTAPRLLQDLLESDPTKNYVPVAVPAPVFEAAQGRTVLPKGWCKHEYSTKLRQSVLPPLDFRPDGTTVYKVAAICKKCRLHADVKIDYTQSTNVCPNSDHPLHHFQRDSRQDEKTQELLGYGYKCSAPQCRAILTISFKPARLKQADIELFTNEDLLKARYEHLMAVEPSRDGMKRATQMEALHRLRRYIRDSLDPDHSKPSFPAHNKRFQEAFGERGNDCRVSLEKLGFKYAEPDGVSTWTLPRPAPNANPLDLNPQRSELEDVEAELLALMIQTATTTGAINPFAAEGWSSANRDLERTLTTQGYTRAVSLRRSTTTSEEQPYFSSLGALPDFADSIIQWAHDRQTDCDPQQQDYYFECLQEIARARGSESLQTSVAMLASQGRVSRKELREAYQFFGISAEEANVLSNETILGRSRSQLADMAPGAIEQGRYQLAKIGQARGSHLLMSAASDSIETYDEALSWLGADKSMADDFILSMYAIKVGENESNSEKGRNAVSIIANARKSSTLENWLLTGNAAGTAMDVEEACQLLGITNGLSSVDKDLLPSIFDSARADRAGETTEKAIEAIEAAMQGSNIVTHSPETWPVGLTSHGNTCYLNSLLQYYFSIKPLRDIVLDYDKYKLDTSQYVEKQQRVGHREITNVEIKGGQKFAKDLQALFERMIKDPGTTVKPESGLVCRAFLDPKDSDLHDATPAEPNATNETLTADLSVTNETHTEGDAVMDDATETTEPPPLITPAIESKKDSDTSSITLLEADEADMLMTSVEMPPTPPASPGARLSGNSEPPHAPPLPPRTEAALGKPTTPLEKAQENARNQQDVTEVHDGIMFRIRAGMKPEGQDEFNEQRDPLNDLFVYGYNETTVTNGQVSKPKPSVNTNVQLNVPYEETDIYSALDAVFDLQPMQEDESVEKYQSLTSLPPFLQINIPRIGYDKTLSRAFKVDKSVKLEDELYLDRYFDSSSDTTLERRKTSWGWRKQLHALNKAKKAMTETGLDIDGPSILRESATYLDHLASINDTLTSVDIPPLDLAPDLSTALTTEADQQAASLAQITVQITSLQHQLATHFSDLTRMKYRLHAVFFHRGGHGHGHYWLYIHDFARQLWRNYNDERVVEFARLDDIFAARSWEQGTPTYAVYVRDDVKTLYVQPVCRAVEQAPTPVPESWQDIWGDIAMLDGVEERQDEAQMGTVDPRLVVEGGATGWDQPRSVAKTEW